LFRRCCEVCGKVVYQDLYTEEPTFVKGAGGEVCHCFFVSVVMQIQSVDETNFFADCECRYLKLIDSQSLIWELLML